MDTQLTNMQALLDRPAVKWILIANIVFFPIGLIIGGGKDFQALGLIPFTFTFQLENGNLLSCLATLLRHQFFHVNLAHLFSNMLFLVAVGLPLEYALGTRRFMILYLLCGMLSGLGLVLSAPNLILPLVGASGAIAGLMGAALVLTRDQPLGQLPIINFTVRAKHVIVVWLLWQFDLLIQSAGSPLAGQMVVHISGLAAGFVIANIWKAMVVRTSE
jgi:membrane associated rhomboid family serine protease